MAASAAGRHGDRRQPEARRSAICCEATTATASDARRRPQPRAEAVRRAAHRRLSAATDRRAAARRQHHRRGSAEQPRADARSSADRRARQLLHLRERRPRPRPAGRGRRRARPARREGHRHPRRRLEHVLDPGVVVRGAAGACPIIFVIINNGRYEALHEFGRRFGLRRLEGVNLPQSRFLRARAQSGRGRHVRESNRRT